MDSRIIKQMSILLVCLFSTFLLSCSNDIYRFIVKPEPAVCNDINVYINGAFDEEIKKSNSDFNSFNSALMFFPNYNIIKYKCEHLSFVMTSCHRFVAYYPCESYILDIYFETKDSYNEYVVSCINGLEFLEKPIRDSIFFFEYIIPVASFELGKFKCNVIDNRDAFMSPGNVKIICFNDDELIVRLCALYDDSRDYISKEDFIDALKNNLYCEW